MNILISVVICTHNRSQYLAKAIQSLLNQQFPLENYEIIIIDNCSTDQTKEVVEQLAGKNLRYIYEPTLGLSYARNTGWKNAQGKYVAYLDDDAIACPLWLSTILEVFETVQPQPGCVGGKAEPIWEAPRPNWLSDELVTGLTVIDWSPTPQVLPDLSRQWLVGANIAFPKAVLEKLGGFIDGLDRSGKHLLSGGDVFLEKQIAQAGYSCYYHPQMAVSHHIQQSRLDKKWFIRRYFWQGVSDAVVQLIEESPSRSKRLFLAILRTINLLLVPSQITSFLYNSDDKNQFTERCFTLIKLGHIAGLLGLAHKPS
ncbi:glycosyl transferase family 2 [Gloeothece citriformis PCC 7424]|uniref:Glycosyl transferase family 2 n=1 Tax=Gloeothece citriformis (strain PCC 7424) TaxID=65393 RepID=B7K6R8_GLOC7|nr:glycosyltransferase [Gloeothece citriformis]ACK72617.1 glycosyl transferase family 2 [Gloeothece citriformis PCC 7424]